MTVLLIQYIYKGIPRLKKAIEKWQNDKNLTGIQLYKIVAEKGDKTWN